MRTSPPRRLFPWHCFDLTSELPENWSIQIREIATSEMKRKDLRATSVTSRESSSDVQLTVLTVGGVLIAQQAPWLNQLYRQRFRELGQSVVTEQLVVAKDQRYALNLNIQQGPRMRYECHVDSNPLEGILYVTTHLPGDGGELVVSNRGDVAGIEAVALDATRIYPISGQLVFFDGRSHSHYVEPLRDENALRVAITMNFYTPSCPEESRPPDLNRHLGIE